MSTRDKTREKLVGSMRKTKAGAGIDSERVDTEPTVPDEASSKPAKPAVRKGADSALSTKSDTVNGNAYQSGGRVWPD